MYLLLHISPYAYISDDIKRPNDFVKYCAFNESRAHDRPAAPPAGLRTSSVKLTRRYGLLMNAMDLRESARDPGTINENIKSV